MDVALAADGAGFELNLSPEPGRESGAEPDVIFRCSAQTYAMVIFGRQKLGPAIDGGLVTAAGDANLVNALY